MGGPSTFRSRSHWGCFRTAPTASLFTRNVNSTPGSQTRQGYSRIQLGPTRVHLVPGSDVFGFGLKLRYLHAREQNHCFGWKRGGDRPICGIFELDLAGRSVKTIVESPTCDPLKPVADLWMMLSLSPDAERATAYRNHRLELLDLTAGKVTSIVGGIEWSVVTRREVVRRS